MTASREMVEAGLAQTWSNGYFCSTLQLFVAILCRKWQIVATKTQTVNTG